MNDTGAFPALEQILREGVDIHRCAAAQALRQFPLSQSGEPLRQALLDEDPDVRSDAIESLKALDARQFAPAILENLTGDPDGKVKLAAIGALAAMRDEASLPVLRTLAASRGEDAGIVWDDGSFYEDGWDDWVDVQLEAIRAMGALGDTGGIAAICDALDDEAGQDVTEFAIPALMQLGAGGAGALEARLNGAPTQFRRRVAQALRDADDENFASLAPGCLADRDAEVRLRALRALRARNPDDARLDQFVNDPDPAVRAEAIIARGGALPDAVRRAMADDMARVRKAAYGVVAASPDSFEATDVTSRIEAAFTDQLDISAEAANAWVALDAPVAIEVLAPEAMGPDLPVELRTGILDAVRQAGTASLPSLADAAVNPVRTVRLHAMALLGEMAAEADDGAAAVLLDVLERRRIPPEPEITAAPKVPADDVADEAPVSGEAADAVAPGSTLDAIKRPPMPPAGPPPEPADLDLDADDLRRMALSKMHKVGKKRVPLEPDIAPGVELRRHAASLLGDATCGPAAAALIAVLADEDAELCRNALDALIQIASRGTTLPQGELQTILPDLVDDGRDGIGLLAIRLAGFVPDPKLCKIVAAHLQDPSRAIRLEATRTLGKTGGARDHLRACLRDSWPAVRLCAAEALARDVGKDAFGPLFELSLFEEGYHHREVARLLANVAPIEATEAFLGVLSDDARKRFWLVAIEALDEIHAARGPDQHDLGLVA